MSYVSEEVKALAGGHPGPRVTTVSSTCLLRVGRTQISSHGCRDPSITSLEKLVMSHLIERAKQIKRVNAES